MPDPQTNADITLSWYHVVLTTYGSWLPGDPRGFRTRHHRLHVEGDYKNPPPAGKYELTHRYAQKSLKQQPVELTHFWKEMIGSYLIEAYANLNVYAACIAVGGHHIHALVKHESGIARKISGRVKLHAINQSLRHGWSGKLWAVRSREELVEDKPHHRNSYYYILDHEQEGAWVWRNPEPLDNMRLLRGITR